MNGKDKNEMVFRRAALLGNDPSSQKPARTELIQAIRDRGVQPFLGRPWDGSLNGYYGEETAQYMPILASRNNTNPFRELQSMHSVARQIRKHRIDAVIIYGVKNHAAMAIGARMGGARSVLCVVNGRGNLFRLKGIKGALVRCMAFPMLRMGYKRCRAVCFQNRDDLELFRKAKLIRPTTDTFVTGGSGVNLELFPAAPMPKEHRFLFLSRITATKGLAEFCEAAGMVHAKHPDTVFDIVGPLDRTVETGSVREVLDRAVSQGIVSYHGYTTQVADWMQKCRYFIYPSYYPEGIPRCVLQALSTGRPVITCRTTGCRETVEEGRNGFLIEPKDPAALAEKMIWLVEHAAEAEQMGAASRELAQRRFNVHEINGELLHHLF